MTILHRYIGSMFFKFFGIVLALVVVIYLSIDVFGRIDNLIEAGLKPAGMLLFFAYKVPLIISQITPVAVLLGVLAAFGLMFKNNEILALKSSGVSLQYIMVPVLAIGLAMSGALFLFTEAFVPATIYKAHQLEEEEGGGSRMVSSREKNIWLKQERKIMYIKYYHPSEEVVHGVTVLFFDRDFSLARRIDAEKGIYSSPGWQLHSAMEQDFGEGGSADIRFHGSMDLELELTPSGLKKVTRSAEEMSFSRLKEYISRVEQEGYDATRYRVDLCAKTAFPAICLIMALFGSAIALRGKTSGGMAVSFAYGLVTAFLYWSLYSLCLSLGYGGVLPPLLSAWTANLFFFCAAGWMVLNLE